MDPLFAPWRMEWITRDNMNDDIDGCVFCKLPQLNNDRNHRLLAYSEHSYVLLNKAPYTPGHILVIPKSHIDSFSSIDDEVIIDIIRLLQKSTNAIKDTLGPDGLNIGINIGEAGGASIEDHIHIHVVPRWQGDTTFMPTIANTKLIPEALDETYDRLHDAFTRMDGTELGSSSHAVLIQ